MSSALTNESMVGNGTININDMDYDENLTFEQLISEYDAESRSPNLPDNTTDGTINTADGDNDNETVINVSTLQSDGIDDQPINLEGDIGLNDRTTRSLRQYIENECYCHSQWSQKLMFRASIDQTTYTEMDITMYIGNLRNKEKVKKGSHRVYFDPNQYSIAEELEKQSNLTEDTSIQDRVKQAFKSAAYLKLSRDLREASGKCGFNITQNGNQKFTYKRTGLIIRNRFSCQRYTVYKGDSKEISGSREYRRYTLHNDRLNQRDLGRKKCRRSYSSKSVSKENRCKFVFYVNFDSYGFYIEPGLGNRNHSYHQPLNTPSQNKTKIGIEEEERTLISDMAEGQSQDSQIQNVLFNKTGKLISRSTIRLITKIHKRNIINDNDFDDMFQGKNSKDLSSTEYMMRYCRSKK